MTKLDLYLLLLAYVGVFLAGYWAGHRRRDRWHEAQAAYWHDVAQTQARKLRDLAAQISSLNAWLDARDDAALRQQARRATNQALVKREVAQ